MEHQIKCKSCKSNKIKSYNLCSSTVTGYRCNTIEEALNAPFFRLTLDYCTRCFLISQRRYFEANSLLDKIYNEHLSTQHSIHNEYFDVFAKKLIKQYSISNNKKILEIGCNCGLMLKRLRDYSGAQVFGIEPSKAMTKIWMNRNLTVINGYLDSRSAYEAQKFGPFDLIYFRHVFEHVPDPVGFIKIVKQLLKSDGIIVVEVPYLISIIKNKRIENVSYSHLHQYCIRSLDAIFNKFSMGLIHYSLESTDGGSIVAHFKKEEKTTKELIEYDIEAEIEKFLNYNYSLKEKVKNILAGYSSGQVIGYGAGAKGQYLIHLLGLEQYMSKVIDDTPGFSGKYIPGSQIQIVSKSILQDPSVKAVINLAPTHSDKIKSNVPESLIFIDFVNEQTVTD